MKNMFKILLAASLLAIAGVASASVLTLDYADGNGSGGTIDGNVIDDWATGDEIFIGSLTLEGASYNGGVIAEVDTNAILTFDTDVGTITIVGDVASFGLTNEVLFSGAFTDFGFKDGFMEAFWGEGSGTTSQLLLDAIGDSNAETFAFIGFTIESANGTVLSTDFMTSEIGERRPPEVPVPAAAWLFGSGLLGLMGVARRKA